MNLRIQREPWMFFKKMKIIAQQVQEQSGRGLDSNERSENKRELGLHAKRFLMLINSR